MNGAGSPSVANVGCTFVIASREYAHFIVRAVFDARLRHIDHYARSAQPQTTDRQTEVRDGLGWATNSQRPHHVIHMVTAELLTVQLA